MTSLDGLIAALEAATEGSRALDRAIHGAPPPPKPAYFWSGIPCHTFWSGVPCYTTSLDAALTLKASHLAWHSDSAPDVQKVGGGRFGHHAAICFNGAWHHGVGKTPALALCIAALRVRKAEEENA